MFNENLQLDKINSLFFVFKTPTESVNGSEQDLYFCCFYLLSQHPRSIYHEWGAMKNYQEKGW
ncbi:hypothetical protein B4914_15515 [Yersinia entomophaga]|nr:hypothetical protein B4914_15515 [Yersinia entomophaga]